MRKILCSIYQSQSSDVEHTRKLLIDYITNPEYDVLPDGIVKMTSDGKRMFRGDKLLELKVTYGFPMEFALTSIFENGMEVDWLEFINYGKYREYYDYQLYDWIDKSLRDAEVDKVKHSEIMENIRLYICCMSKKFHHLIKCTTPESRKYKEYLITEYCYW